jgi:hypothetical protein
MDKLIMAAPNKQCDLDPAPTWVIKKFHHIMGTVFSHLINASLSQGNFSRDHKSALVRSTVKKATLESGPIRPQIIPSDLKPVIYFKVFGKISSNSAQFTLSGQ